LGRVHAAVVAVAARRRHRGARDGPVGGEDEAWTAPVVLGDARVGRLWVTGLPAPLSPLERRAIERFALVVGVELGPSLADAVPSNRAKESRLPRGSFIATGRPERKGPQLTRLRGFQSLLVAS